MPRCAPSLAFAALFAALGGLGPLAGCEVVKYLEEEVPSGEGTSSEVAGGSDSETTGSIGATDGFADTDTGERTSLAVAQRAHSAIDIDGELDEEWRGRIRYPIEKVLLPLDDEFISTDLYAEFGVLWDDDALYLMVDVDDEVMVADSQWLFFDDAVEVYFDVSHNEGSGFGPDDYQYGLGIEQAMPYEVYSGATANVVFAVAATVKGYRLEARFPFSTLGRKPFAGMLFGFDVAVDDDDSEDAAPDGDDRERQQAWHAESFEAFRTPSMFGDCRLAE